MGGELTQPPQLLPCLLNAVARNHPALALQRQQLLGAQFWDHPIAPSHRESSNGSPSFPVVDDVRIEKIKKNGEEYWRVSGLGYCVEHRQRWQAEVTWECLRSAKGESRDITL